MTSFVAWVGVDSRGPASMYFASDSRISWDGYPDGWDCGRKVFTSQTQAEIFGFVGYVLLPQNVLQRSCDVIDRGLRLAAAQDAATSRAEWLFERIQHETASHPSNLLRDFTVFHGLRIGEGMPGKSTFHMYATSWSAKTKSLTMTMIAIPTEKSSVLRIDGSGSVSVTHWSKLWERSDQGNTSRTIFSGFCDSLKSKTDPKTGGEPQLVGMYRKGPAKTFGVVTEQGPSFQGVLDQAFCETASIEWRDVLFQRVNPSGGLLKKAKKHSRPKQVAAPASTF